MFVFGVILVCIFPHSDWIWKDTLYLSVFSLNARKYGTLFTQCMTWRMKLCSEILLMDIKLFPSSFCLFFKVARVPETIWIETQLKQPRRLRMHNTSIITLVFEYSCSPFNEFPLCASKIDGIKSFLSQRTTMSK